MKQQHFPGKIFPDAILFNEEQGKCYKQPSK